MEASAANEVALPLSGARLIVVEDDFLILMELESALTDAGAKIVGSCRTLNAAMSLVEADGLAAAILDIRLGRDTVEPAARRLAERGIPLIFYTGQSETDAVRMMWPRSALLHKPANPKKIVAAISELLHA